MHGATLPPLPLTGALHRRAPQQSRRKQRHQGAGTRLPRLQQRLAGGRVLRLQRCLAAAMCVRRLQPCQAAGMSMRRLQLRPAAGVRTLRLLATRVRLGRLAMGAAVRRAASVARPRAALGVATPLEVTTPVTPAAATQATLSGAARLLAPAHVCSTPTQPPLAAGPVAWSGAAPPQAHGRIRKAAATQGPLTREPSSGAAPPPSPTLKTGVAPAARNRQLQGAALVAWSGAAHWVAPTHMGSTPAQPPLLLGLLARSGAAPPRAPVQMRKAPAASGLLTRVFWSGGAPPRAHVPAPRPIPILGAAGAAGVAAAAAALQRRQRRWLRRCLGAWWVVIVGAEAAVGIQRGGGRIRGRRRLVTTLITATITTADGRTTMGTTAEARQGMRMRAWCVLGAAAARAGMMVAVRVGVGVGVRVL